MEMEQGVGGDEHEVERSAEVELAHVALHPLHVHPALVRLALSLGEHVGRELQARARMPVGRDRDQLVPGAAPELQDGPALPSGLGPIEVDGLSATGEQPVVQPRVRVELLAHEAPPSDGPWTPAFSADRRVAHCRDQAETCHGLSKRPHVGGSARRERAGPAAVLPLEP